MQTRDHEGFVKAWESRFQGCAAQVGCGADDCVDQTATNPRAKENTQMKAMVLTRYGSADALELQQVAKPAPKDHQVLIKVQATALNAADHHLMKGALLVRLANGLLRPKYPILGADVAGRVEAAQPTRTSSLPRLRSCAC
jgi:Alcohol dehydrogenase GroES-like domain